MNMFGDLWAEKVCPCTGMNAGQIPWVYACGNKDNSIEKWLEFTGSLWDFIWIIMSILLTNKLNRCSINPYLLTQPVVTVVPINDVLMGGATEEDYPDDNIQCAYYVTDKFVVN